MSDPATAIMSPDDEKAIPSHLSKLLGGARLCTESSPLGSISKRECLSFQYCLIANLPPIRNTQFCDLIISLRIVSARWAGSGQIIDFHDTVAG